MNRLISCLLLASLGGCATLPGTVTFHTAAAGAGDKYALTCEKSSSDSCHVRIETANGDISFATIAVGSTQLLEHAEPGAKFCVSTSEPGWLGCKMSRMYFGPQGTLGMRL